MPILQGRNHERVAGSAIEFSQIVPDICIWEEGENNWTIFHNSDDVVFKELVWASERISGDVIFKVDQGPPKARGQAANVSIKVYYDATSVHPHPSNKGSGWWISKKKLKIWWLLAPSIWTLGCNGCESRLSSFVSPFQ